MNKYELIIYWSDDDQAFVVEVPELPGCMADGATYTEAVANAEKVIAHWIQTAEELGRPIPRPRGRLMYA
ncbi:MAG: type II toxin-antitoxin system HicB family antitoxin [Gammaproteobacteria bacterium]|nr:type II toxin-antitoxin system HicB family antitoxin [Gammaproteobacteria bacterium]